MKNAIINKGIIKKIALALGELNEHPIPTTPLFTNSQG